LADSNSSILDRLGKAVGWGGSEPEPVAKAARGSAMQGSAGVTVVGGYVTTDERLPELVGTKRYETYVALVNDITIIAASVRLFLNLIAKSEWQVQPAEVESEADKARAEEIAKLVESMMKDHKTPWRRIIRKVAMFRFLGFAIMEWTAKKRADGAIGMDDVQHRPQRTINRWDVDEQGTVKGVWQYNTSFVEVYLPIDRLIYAVDDTLTDAPDGTGLMRNVARSALRLKAYETLEEIGFETDLRGIPVAYAPLEEMDAAVKAGTMSEADRRRYRKPMVDFISGHVRSRKMGLLLPSSTYRDQGEDKSPSSTRKWAAELLRGEATSYADVGKAITRLCREIARVFGTEHLLDGAEGSGSLAMSKSKTGTFYLNGTSTLYELVEVMQGGWLQPIADMNGWPDELVPTLAVEEIRDEDIDQITKALADLAQAGVVLTPEDAAVAEVFQMIGLTPPDPDLQMNADVDDVTDPADQPSAVDLPDEPRGVTKRWIRATGRKG
jgi:hypothetical protein